MRRPTLAVDTTNARADHELEYELSVSPRTSIDSHVSSIITDLKKPVDEPTAPTPAPPNTPSPPSLTPSIRLLFSLLSRRHFFLILLPAILASLVSGGIAPFMTFVIGQAFDAFAKFPLTPNPPQEAKDELLKGVGIAALELVGLGVGSLALGSVTSCLWIWAGEVNVGELRRRVYKGVMGKEMGWFDSRMGSAEGGELKVASDEAEGPVGAGGLMAKFTRDTDDVRHASSLASGLLIQHLTTTLTCLILAFLRSWALTLVILSAVPLLVLIQAISQSFATPLLLQERTSISVSATIIDRCLNAITTIKAFNAQPTETARADRSFETMKLKAKRLSGVWGFTSGLAHFVMMGMFVQGFWFGSKLVREGKVSPGDVMAVFWACLIATSNLQMCIPHSITMAKGKEAMASLMSLAGDEPSSHPSHPPPAQGAGVPPSPKSPSSISTGKFTSTPTTAMLSPATKLTPPKNPKTTPFRHLRKITPARCYGELALHNITFAYPTRPSVPVLEDVSLYLPAREMTFIVGSSGSGKSTVAQLLLRMYDVSSSSSGDKGNANANGNGNGQSNGYLTLDEQDVTYLDVPWVRSKIMGITQSTCVILEGRTFFENIACATERPVSKEEVEEACRAALIHEFVRDLPGGYETVLGGGGITAQDFVYVLKKGRVVEQGYRSDLEVVAPPSPSPYITHSDSYIATEDKAQGKGEFRKMMESQLLTGGFLPTKDLSPSPTPPPPTDEVLALEAEAEEDLLDTKAHIKKKNRDTLGKHQSILRPLTLGNWMFDVVAELVSPPVPAALRNTHTQFNANGELSVTRFVPPGEFGAGAGMEEKGQRQRRPSSVHIESPTASTYQRRPWSLQFTPVTPTSASFGLPPTSHHPHSNPAAADQEEEEEEDEFEQEKEAVKKSGGVARDGRSHVRGMRERRGVVDVVVEKRGRRVHPSPSGQDQQDKGEDGEEQEHQAEEQRPPFWSTNLTVFPNVPNKPLLLLGLLICIASGAMTPIFSFLLSRLLFEVSIGAQNVSTINTFGAIVLCIAAADGFLLGSKFFIMEYSGVAWVTRLRSKAFGNLVGQDTRFFDKRPEHGVPKLVQVIVKDAEDARNLIATVWGQCLVVTTMLSVGLVWAMARGWQLTLVGLGVAPVFAGVMSVQTALVAKCELRNKRAREDVAKGYYEAIINVRGIRAMAFERLFWTDFDKATNRALTTGVRGAFVEGCTYGVASGLIYLAEALLFYVGAVLIARGTYTYLQMVEVLNLVVFSVTIGSQLMAFTEKIAKSVQATSDLNKLVNLSTDSTDESRGFLKPPISGDLTFHDVYFSYPERSEAPVLRGVDVQIKQGECVAIVGSSGSGKSTMAALLQRLYEPTSGSVFVGHTQLRDIDVRYLRDNISVVSQHPNLFDASIAENIRYGNASLSLEDVQEAARAASVHEFIMSLPQGYDTVIGENASLISGGQAQRLQIARALARPSRILILDECTSALDPENQAAVMETIGRVKEGRTTVMVTHKMQVMLMCDRIVVVGEGEVKEEGTYEELMRRNGVFATLASGGEWNGD
ncbi:hypothetical protein MD484_g7239, partial [Candolleomyces efflorescens]